MKKIPLTKGKFAIVDDEDFEELNQFKWCVRHGYAVRNAPQIARVRFPMISMHRVIMRARPGQEIDHINRDKLDNRRVNLRFSTHQQNCFNRGANRNNHSGFKGVSWDKGTRKWRAVIHLNRHKICLGLYKDKHYAGCVYRAASKKYHGEFSGA